MVHFCSLTGLGHMVVSMYFFDQNAVKMCVWTVTLPQTLQKCCSHFLFTHKTLKKCVFAPSRLRECKNTLENTYLCQCALLRPLFLQCLRRAEDLYAHFSIKSVKKYIGTTMVHFCSLTGLGHMVVSMYFFDQNAVKMCVWTVTLPQTLQKCCSHFLFTHKTLKKCVFAPSRLRECKNTLENTYLCQCALLRPLFLQCLRRAEDLYAHFSFKSVKKYIGTTYVVLDVRAYMSYVVIYGPCIHIIWPISAIHVTIYRHICSYMTMYWPYLIIYVHIWSYIVIYTTL